MLTDRKRTLQKSLVVICSCSFHHRISAWYVTKTSLSGTSQCFSDGRLNADVCCNTHTDQDAVSAQGTHRLEKVPCWKPPLWHLHRDVCCDPTGRDKLLQQLQGKLLVAVAALDSNTARNVGDVAEDIWEHLRTDWEHTAFAQAIEDSLWPMQQPVHLANQSNLVPQRMEQGIVVLAMLKALCPGASWVLVRRAYLNFLRVRFTVWDWLQSPWPVFALAELLWRRLQLANSTQNKQDAGAEKHTACIEPSKPSHFAGCSAKVVMRSDTARNKMLQLEACTSSCVAAASALAPAHALKTRKQAAASSELRQMILEEIGATIALQGSRSLVRLGVQGSWKVLHEIHQSITLVGPCPIGAVQYSTDADPPFTVCLPLNTPRHIMETIIGAGRWKDCDPLHAIAWLTRKLSARLGLVDVAVDVGFNIGFCTKYLLAMGFRVHAVDLQEKEAHNLRRAAWQAEEDGRLSIHSAFVTNVQREGSFARWGWGGVPSEEGLDLPVLRLDKLLHDEPGPVLMKLDVDGWELEALQGASGLLQKGQLAAVLLELHCDLLANKNVDCWEPLNLLIHHGLKVMLIARWIIASHLDEENFWVSSRESFVALKEQLMKYDGSPNLQVVAARPELWPLTSF